MTFRVCILTAGTGSRLGDSTRFINKSLVSVGNKPILTRIIEKFDKSIEFVIAVGYRGDLVREYLSLAHPDRKFTFVDVHPYEGEGSGSGLSLNLCRQHLQCPFIFVSCDTLVDEDIPPPAHNWLGYADVETSGQYRSISIDNGAVEDLYEKNEPSNKRKFPYIGIAGIHTYQEFWSCMDDGCTTIGESYGIRKIVNSGFKAVRFTWCDTGNLESLAHTRSRFKRPDDPNILEKKDEAIWFVDDRVIKFSNDTKFIEERFSRAKQLEGYIPQVCDRTDHMYSYVRARGTVMSECVTTPVFLKFLENCQQFWTARSLSFDSQSLFRESCMKFYRSKTLERVERFYTEFDRKDDISSINGTQVPSLREMLEEIDWNWISDGIPVRFHGDFHFENILYDEIDSRFIFLDWRQNFAGDIETGDLYYDLAKLLHGIIMNHEIVANDQYTIDWKEGKVRYDFHRKQSLVDCEKEFELWCNRQGYSWKKVRTLTALIYLNIAALHHHPYSLLLYSLGKMMLYETGTR